MGLLFPEQKGLGMKRGEKYGCESKAKKSSVSEEKERERERERETEREGCFGEVGEMIVSMVSYLDLPCQHITITIHFQISFFL